MGVAVMMAAVLGFWKFVSHRAAFILMAFLAFGLLAYWTNPEQTSCADKAWFCALVKDREPIVRAPEPCPPDEAAGIVTPVFQSDAANAELQRQMQSGVCLQTAINRIARGWKAPFNPAYESGKH